MAEEKTSELFALYAKTRSVEVRNKIAEKYITVASKSASIFEVNTGAISRGMRKSSYPSENLLYTLKKLDARLILSSDSHNSDTLDFGFEEEKKHLKDIGFSHLYTIYNGEFIKYKI
jgi:histidinol-phosphatase (PHP family)